MRLCLILPAFNEEAAIQDTIEEYRLCFPKIQIVVIDNNSNDETVKRAADSLDMRRDLIVSEKRQGKGFAVKSGLSRIDADIYIMTDADATYPAEDASLLVAELVKTRADMIVGDRVSGGAYERQNLRVGHGFGNRFLTMIISKLAGQRYFDVLSGLRVMSRPFVSKLDVRASGFQLETELNVVAAFLRAHVIEIPISYRQRGENSHSKLNTIKDGFRILSFALSNWIAFAPLQPFLLVASFAGALSALLGFRVIFGFLNTGWPYTTTAVAAVASGLIAILAIFFGLTLKILVRNARREEISSFLESKRLWNAALDETCL